MELEDQPPLLHEALLDGRAVLKVYGNRFVGMTAADIEQHFGKGKDSSGEDRLGTPLRFIRYRLDWFPSNPARCATFILKNGKVCEVEVGKIGWATFH